MPGEISRRETGRVGRVDTSGLTPYMARKVQLAVDDDAGAALIAREYLESAAVVVEQAITLTAELSAEAASQPVHSPYDAERYQSYVAEFALIAHRTLRAYGGRL